MSELFALPVDPTRVVVRRAPETPLIAIPMESGTRAHLFVAQPASRSALDMSDVERLRAYFRWEDTESHWWRTLRPAVVSLEQLTAGTWCATLEERGEILAAGYDPRVMPGEQWLFRTLLDVRAHELPLVIGSAHGPQPRPDSRGRTEMLRSKAFRVTRVWFPSIGPEVAWLRLFEPGYERDSFIGALASELDVLSLLAEEGEQLVARPLHDGTLQSPPYQGRYTALEQPQGLPLDEILTADGTELFPARGQMLVGALLDIARAMQLAHQHQRCIGPVSPAFICVRPSFSGAQVARATLVALPGAGRVGSRLPPRLVDLFPEGAVPPLLAQVDDRPQHTIEQDLVGLGYLTDWLLDRASERDRRLRRLAASLRTRKLGSAAHVIKRLDSLEPIS